MRRDANYGQGKHQIASAEAEAVGAMADLRDQLREVLQDPSYSPPVLPRVALEVHEMAQANDVALGKVIKILSHDALLASRVLKRAQSPVFAARVPVSSLEDAVRRLGLSNVRDVVWEVALHSRVFRCKPYRGAMEELATHSTATALCCRFVAMKTNISPGYAFLAGLLHDVGLAAMLVILGERKQHPPLELVVPDMIALHELAAETLAKAWKLPPDLAEILGHHHHPKKHPVVGVLVVGQAIAGALGRGLTWANNHDAIPVDQLQGTCRQLGLTQRSIESVMERVQPLL